VSRNAHTNMPSNALSCVSSTLGGRSEVDKPIALVSIFETYKNTWKTMRVHRSKLPSGNG
jgi:hypothetical protein